MRSNDQLLSEKKIRLFHISEQPGINLFEPRPSPSYFEEIRGDVVFAVEDRLLHNYLLPRDCPRVTWYVRNQTTDEDQHRFVGKSRAEFFITVESGWYQRMKETVLYCYEFSPDNFELLDANAGYYISYQPVEPISTTIISDILQELLSRNIELRFTTSLIELANEVSKSSLNFSNIRMRNAKR